MQGRSELLPEEQHFGHASLVPRRSLGVARQPRPSREAHLAMILLELRSSLRAVRGAVRLLDVPQAGTLASENERLLIEHELSRISGFIDQLLEASRTRPRAHAFAPTSDTPS